MTKKMRSIALLVSFVVLFVMLCSAFYIVAEADHDCTGENCPICYQISVCQNTLKDLSFAVCTAAFGAAFTYTLCQSVSARTEDSQSNTLVSLKVKLSD